MSQDNTDPELDDDGNPIEAEDGNGLPGLRKKAKAGERALSENLDLRKQLAFMKAGIDPDSSKMAKGFYETYKGDFSDITALKAEATEWGLIKDEAEPAEPAKGEVVDPQRAEEDAQRQQMQDALTGGRPGGTEAPTPHPRHAAMEQYQVDIRSGKSQEAAATDAFAKVLAAANQGDRRVFFDAEAHRRDALEADRIAGRPSGVI